MTGKRLYYHPESGGYFVEVNFQFDGADGALCVDVTGEDDHELAAVLQGVDIDDLEAVEDGELPEGLNRPVEAQSGLAGAIAASMAKWARKPADLYPTPPDCVYSLQPLIEDLLPRGSAILEPACAEGKMVKAMEECGYEVDGYDLRPDVTGGLGGVDFLDRDNGMFGNREYAAVWTNPPFNAADAFIRRALEIAPVVVMLLKSNYWNTKNRRKLWNDHRPTRIYSLTWRPAFLEEERGKSPLMDCIWVVFERDRAPDQPCEFDIIVDRLMSAPMDFGGL